MMDDYHTPRPRGFHFAFGDRVQKKRGSNWHGRVVGFYSTALTPEGYAVESEREPGSVQIYPYEALERIDT
jgi:dihydrofolate reductase (trimethoprim resistance protein)